MKPVALGSAYKCVQKYANIQQMSMSSPSIGPPTAFTMMSPPKPPPTQPPLMTNIGHGSDYNSLRYSQQQAAYQPPSPQQYGPQELQPLTYHWFYNKEVDGKPVWKPFSLIDSVALEEAYNDTTDPDPDKVVATDGGRYDVYVHQRKKRAVYWEEEEIDVRRGSWFYKGPMDSRFIPYDEQFGLDLERNYAECMRTGLWQKRIELIHGESVIMHNAGVVVHFCQAAAPDDWGNLPENQIRPRVVKRGVEEIEVEDGESSQVDHLVFVVHGIGPICDFKLRNIIEAVDNFRGMSFQLLQSHFKESSEQGLVGRVEFLPVSWHKALHGDKGLDEQLKRITLRSIPKFRDFTNETLLDILFYTSPVYCQTIIDAVSSELNRLHSLFLTRNPSFTGKVSLVGHSLGSLILFDLLAHQSTERTDLEKNDNNESQNAAGSSNNGSHQEVVAASSSSRTINYTVGTAGTGQPYIIYPKINFSTTAFFALGSPISMFVTVRGIQKIEETFSFPSCPGFFNIFHPYDPVAYRIETLIDPTFESRPVLIPHHKGRKRIHLELKETMARVGADLKHRVMDAVKSTLNTVYHYAGMNQVNENQMNENQINNAIVGEMQSKSDADGAEEENADITIGNLNGGRRIDHVLQEAPYEIFNEYVFAMGTHVGYWESEDTMLLILTEIYRSLGIAKDSQVTVSQGTAVTSPIHPLPPTTGLGAPPMQYKPSSVNSSPYQSSFQPSAPPGAFGDYQGPGNQPMYPYSVNSAAAPTPPLVPMIQQSDATGMLPPNPLGQSMAPGALTSAAKKFIGNRPIVDPASYPIGMDPTAPMSTSDASSIGPPPKGGFIANKQF